MAGLTQSRHPPDDNGNAAQEAKEYVRI